MQLKLQEILHLNLNGITWYESDGITQATSFYGGRIYVLKINASDIDGDTLTYTVTSSDTNVTITQDTTNPNRFNITFPVYQQDTQVQFTITVSDGKESASMTDTRTVIGDTTLIVDFFGDGSGVDAFSFDNLAIGTYNSITGIAGSQSIYFESYTGAGWISLSADVTTGGLKGNCVVLQDNTVSTGWIDLPSIGGESYTVTFYYKYTFSGIGVGYFLFNNIDTSTGYSLRPYYYFHNNELFYITETSLTSLNFSFSVGSWYHIAIVIDKTNNNYQLYINGTFVHSQSSLVPTKVGFWTPIYIDQLRIFNRALTPQEILQLKQELLP